MALRGNTLFHAHMLTYTYMHTYVHTHTIHINTKIAITIIIIIIVVGKIPVKSINTVLSLDSLLVQFEENN